MNSISFTVISYFNEKPEEKTSISLIPKSHKKSFRISINNILRIIHWKSKGKKFFIWYKKFNRKINFFKNRTRKWRLCNILCCVIS